MSQDICIFLEARENTTDFDHFKSIKIFDKILVSLIQEKGMQRFLLCPTCVKLGKDHYFFDVGPGFEPHNEMDFCKNLNDEDTDDEDSEDCVDQRHSIDPKHMCLIQREGPKEVTLHQFLKEGIENIEKRPFRDIESELQVGDQVWIYRDRSSKLQSCCGASLCNPVAVLMPYAHVAIFVGIEDGQKKVVHVTKASCWDGILTGTIKKDSIGNVINQDDRGRTKTITKCAIFFLVFLGHKIPEVRHALNTREKIAAMAKALADPPQLLFDYDQHDNCEAFANFLNGAADLEHDEGIRGVQTAHWCVSACCCLINCFRSCRKRVTLRDAVRRRLAERE